MRRELRGRYEAGVRGLARLMRSQAGLPLASDAAPPRRPVIGVLPRPSERCGARGL